MSVQTAASKMSLTGATQQVGGQATDKTAIRPFRMTVPEEELTELRRRIEATRWPDPVVEQMKIIGPLADPTAHGGRAEEAFDVVVPSMPGYGYSGKPTTTGWGPERIARAYVELMQRLGYDRYAAQGGDWGGLVVDVMGAQAPPGLIGIHTNFPGAVRD